MVHHHCARIVIALALALLLMPASVHAAGQTQVVSMPASGLDPLGNTGAWCKLGQRLTIEGTVSEIGYRICREGNPTGDIILSIYDVQTDELLFSKVWGDASGLPISHVTQYSIVSVTPPLVLDQEVRLCVEYYGGNATDYCMAGYYSGDKITGQSYTNGLHNGNWHNIGEAEEGAYYLSYIPAFVPVHASTGPTDGIPAWAIAVWVIIGVTLIVLLGLYYVKRRSHVDERTTS